MQLFGRNSVSGTYGYFKEEALCKGDFRPNVNEQPGSASVVQSVSQSLNGIGYSGIGYKTASVKTVALAKKEGAAFVEDNEQNALNGTYPLSRFLYVYVNKAPNKPLDPLEAQFLAGSVQDRPAGRGQGRLHPAAGQGGREGDQGTGPVIQ